MSIGGSQFDACFVISSDLFVDAILGLDFIDLHNCVIDCKNKVLFFWLENISVDLQHAGGTRETNFVRLATTQKIVVSPESEMEIMVRPVSDQGVEEGMWMVENDRAKSHGVVVARAIVCPRNGLVPIRIVNPRECSIVLKKGVELAIMEQVTEESVIRNVSTADNMETKNISPAVQETLWSLVSEVGDHISPGDKEQLLALLLEYADVFSVKSGDLGRTSMLQHRIDTGNSLPIHLPPRRLPQARREEARRLMQEMADAGVIEPSEGPWSSPVVLVRKKDGSIRFCVDYRKVNAVTRKDAYPLPRVDDTLDTLGGSTFFTTLDLASGYWQVEVAVEDRPKTAFTTPEGLYQFKVMPFGLCNAPATFQRLMDRVLGGLKWSSCLVYLDNVIVVGRTYLCHVASVLRWLREAGLKLKPAKCNFCKQQVTFLGHVVSAQGIATDPSKTNAISKWPTPQSRRELQQFLGLANYYRRFIKNFAIIAKPLHRITEKNTPYLSGQPPANKHLTTFVHV